MISSFKGILVAFNSNLFLFIVKYYFRNYIQLTHRLSDDYDCDAFIIFFLFIDNFINVEHGDFFAFSIISKIILCALQNK